MMEDVISVLLCIAGGLGSIAILFLPACVVAFAFRLVSVRRGP